MRNLIEETNVCDGTAYATISGKLNKAEVKRFLAQPDTEDYGQGVFFHQTGFHGVMVYPEAGQFEIEATDEVNWCGSEDEAIRSAKSMRGDDMNWFESLVWTPGQIKAKKEARKNKANKFDWSTI